MTNIEENIEIKGNQISTWTNTDEKISTKTELSKEKKLFLLQIN